MILLIEKENKPVPWIRKYVVAHFCLTLIYNVMERLVRRFLILCILLNMVSFMKGQESILPQFPIMKYKEPKGEAYKKDRAIIINTPYSPSKTAGLELRKFTTNSNSEKAYAIPVNSIDSFYVRNLNYYNIKKIKVEQSGENYSFEFNLKSLYDGAKDDSDKPQEGQPNGEEESSNLVSPTDDSIQSELLKVKNNFIKLKDINLEYLLVIKAYKDSLRLFYSKNQDLFTNDDNKKIYEEILSWQPEHVAISTTPFQAPDKDLVKYSIEYTRNDNSTIENEYTFRTTKGWAVSVNNQLFFTKLVNQSVYRDSIQVGDKKEVRAKLEDKDWSVGIGAGAEVSYRTGTSLRPTLTASFFVPFEEDIIPYFGFAPGISVGSKNVKLSLSCGYAFGKVNAIKSRYLNKDISNILDLENSIVEKRWKKDLLFSFGLSYNL
jgi:hypothetical protein